ncbi:poly(R)-hydroxyalkanoic acid synthase subunit PhaE [Sphingomonas sp.]|uniref:poly(R)-hydroxyalkanoic acid synthase subunit PhaE n=1 Tax=Sphingomonas sp. TaxID=28214 RepID=UPI003CC5FE78
MATDPGAFFRTMLGEWEKLANGVGGEMLKTDGWSQAMNAGQNAHIETQAAMKAMSERALAAANLPSRSEFADLSARIGRIEAALERIEGHLTGTPVPTSGRPKPTRGRTPPAAV